MVGGPAQGLVGRLVRISVGGSPGDGLQGGVGDGLDEGLDEGVDDRAAREDHRPVYEWYRRGMDLLGRGSASAALQVLTRAVDAEPGSRSAREALARAQFDAGDYFAARANFAVLVAVNPTDDYAHFGLGLAARRTGDLDAAVEHLALAAAMRPDLSDYTRALSGARAARRTQGHT
jgi:tetratricopeptide (TPR) repeat protein